MPKRHKRSYFESLIRCTIVISLLLFLCTLIYFVKKLSISDISHNFRDDRVAEISYYKEKRTLTLFTTLMNADDDPLRYRAQENTISILADLPSTYFVVFTNSTEWIRICNHIKIHVFTEIQSNLFGTPLLKSMFQFAFDHFESDFYGYVNADILLDDTLIVSLNRIRDAISAGNIQPGVYIVGQRTNVQQTLNDKYVRQGDETANDYVVRMLMKGHRYWDSAVDYHIVSRNTFNWDKMPDFVIGRSGYDIYLVQVAYLDPKVTLIDLTNTVHCAHMLSKDGNRSGLKRKTPDQDWNNAILRSLPDGCCQYKSFSKLADRHTVQLNNTVCVAQHGFEGYYDDSYYDSEKEFIRMAMAGKVAENCLLVSEGDILGLLLPFCRNLMVIIINNDACERTYKRLTGCGVDVQIGCNRNKMSPRELVLSMFQRIDTMFDMVVIQSEKPLVMIKWIYHRLSVNGVLIMRRWLDPVERREIEKVLGDSYTSLGTYPVLFAYMWST